jgi:CHAT domain-containing protein
LIEVVSLSRIHSAYHLEHVLAVREAPPARYYGIIAPTRQNTERASWPELQRYLRQPISWLAAHLEGDAAENESATLEQITATDLRGRVLHFSAHGLFPRDDDGTPFENSGIILGTNGHLADEDRLRAADLAGVLTPMHVVDAGLDFAESHVSLMSCVSGLSREGLGGDALGIEWALLQAGSASLIASHWNVNAPLAAAFFERFYEHWLAGGRSRGDALRQTVMEFRAEPAPYSKPECWAAFSLTGDWR